MDIGIKGLWILAAGLMLAGTASADTGKNRDREALRRVQQQVMQMQGQVSELSADKDKLTQDLGKVSGELGAAKARTGQVRRKLDEETKKREALEAELAETKAKLDETQARLDETQAKLDQTESEKVAVQRQKDFGDQQLASCEDKNKSLYGIGRDLMVRFEHKSCGEVLAQGEPFTGLKHVEVENLLEEYRDKLDDQQYLKPPGG